MFPVLWSIDTLDWQSLNVSAILQIVQNEVKDGSIILMHDAYPTSVEAALEIVDQLTDQGYTFVTVDKLINSV
jgi:peptidoglycan/xylan/chitin deacetylase (PgdA/CDA1 family)